MPVTPQQPSGHTEGLPEPTAEAAVWVVIPCGPCIPIMLGLASLTAFFIITTAVLAERLFRRPQPAQEEKSSAYESALDEELTTSDFSFLESLIKVSLLGMVACSFNLSTQEAEPSTLISALRRQRQVDL